MWILVGLGECVIRDYCVSFFVFVFFVRFKKEVGLVFGVYLVLCGVGYRRSMFGIWLVIY